MGGKILAVSKICCIFAAVLNQCYYEVLYPNKEKGGNDKGLYPRKKSKALS